MKNILNTVLNIFFKKKLEKRKQALKEKLELELKTTNSDWVKIRNQSYLDILENADGKVLNIIEEKIKEPNNRQINQTDKTHWAITIINPEGKEVFYKNSEA